VLRIDVDLPQRRLRNQILAEGKGATAAASKCLPVAILPRHRRLMRRPLLDAVLAILAVLLSGLDAHAHPHVWATTHSEVFFTSDGALAGVRHIWTFDDMFSAFALQGIPHARKGQYTREELSSLARTNVTSLKEYNFFTYAKAGGKKLPFSDAVDYWLEYKDEALTLHFTLPLKMPLKAPRIQIEIYDPEIFVDLEFAKENPASLAGAPPGCQLKVELPHQPTPSEQLRLSQLDESPLDPSSAYGAIFANRINISCP
jgi:ABC-type uncharacterized transport system substrate-binding protein